MKWKVKEARISILGSECTSLVLGSYGNSSSTRLSSKALAFMVFFRPPSSGREAAAATATGRRVLHGAGAAETVPGLWRWSIEDLLATRSCR